MPLKVRSHLQILSLALVFSLSGCGETSDYSATPEVKSQTIVGTNGQLIAIQSDNVHSAGYDANSLTMTVRFKNGYTYEYFGVSAELWEAFITAQPHPWSQVGYPQLVQAGVPYRRIA